MSKTWNESCRSVRPVGSVSRRSSMPANKLGPAPVWAVGIELGAALLWRSSGRLQRLWDSRATCALGSIGVELPRRRRGEQLTGPQFGGRKGRVVGGVRKVLGLQCQSVSLTVGPPSGADMGTVQEVAAIQLQPGLVGQHLQHAPGGGVGQPSGPTQASSPQYVVVVIAPGGQQLGVRVAQARADSRLAAEVQRGAGHLGDLAGRDQVLTQERELVGVYHERMCLD